jgi:hypothetical protein
LTPTPTTVSTERYINHKQLPYYLRKLREEPCLQCGSNVPEPPNAWFREKVILEFPLGELCRNELSALALCGLNKPVILSLTGEEGFDAQGLEGKAQVKKDLLIALMCLRDILPERRCRIVRERGVHST